MKNVTKGALAAGTAAVLLMGGAGTLAFWTAEDDVNGGTIAAGELKLTAVGCDAGWVYAPGNAGAGGAVTTIVPGDAITKSCTFTVLAKGDHLSATPTTPTTLTYQQTAGDVNPAPTLSLTVGAAYTINSAPVTTITPANNGQTLSAAITVTFPYGDATTVNLNDTQNLVATLDDLTVTLTQDDPNA